MGLRDLDDAALLAALRGLYAPGAPEPDVARLTRELRGRVVEVAVPGGAVAVDLGDWTSILLVRLGAWEPHLGLLARRVIRPGEVVVDAGAHVGVWTLLFASLVGEGGRVIAVEPSPENAARARAATERLAQVVVVEAALGEVAGRARLYGYSSGSRFAGADGMLHSLYVTEGYDPAAAIDVEVRVLAGLGVDQVDFLKLDTEGAELAVLRGGRELLARSPDPRLLVELHAEELVAQGSSPAEVYAELAAQGFTVFDLRPEGARLMVTPLAGAPATHHVFARRDPAPFHLDY